VKLVPAARLLPALAVQALRALSGAALSALALPACEVIVPDTASGFACVPGAGACPEGQVCNPATHECVPGQAAEGGVPTDATAGGPDVSPPLDSGPFAGCTDLACACTLPADCTSNVCATKVAVTAPAYAAAGNTGFCTKPCCSSADCDARTVCFATAAGGNFCVRPEWLGRSSQLGEGFGGAGCAADSDCRSGLCDGSSCADVCCSSAEVASHCAVGEACLFGTFPGRSFDKRFVAYCATPTGSAGSGAPCSADVMCSTGICGAADNKCHDACRNSSDCGSPSQECAYSIPNLNTLSSLVSACASSLGQGAQGAACQNNNGCQSGFCDATSKQCTDVCYGDSDCTVSGWRCRPQLLPPTPYSVLACGS
jgi:hypothetical protein